MHTTLLDGPTSTESLNLLYSMTSITNVLDHIETFTHKWTITVEFINNFYELPIIELVVSYLHGAVGFPTKATWTNSTRMGNYLIWLLLTLNKINKFLPELKEKQRGRIFNQRQGIRSTENKKQAPLSEIAVITFNSSHDTILVQNCDDENEVNFIENIKDTFIAT